MRPAISALRRAARAVTRFGIGLTVLLSACVSLPPPAGEQIFSGRFALSAIGRGADGTPQNENLSGRFTLAIAATTTTIDLASPLGPTLARLEASPEGARLQVPDGGSLREVRDSNAEQLAERVLGFPLPLIGLRWWILGEPAPDRPARVSREGRTITHIEQDDWSIRVDERFEGYAAPRRLTLARAASAQSPSILLRVVLDAPGAR